MLTEAQAMGVPVVTTPRFGAAEAVMDGVTGHVVASSSSNDPADALATVLNNPATAERLSKAGPDWVAKRFGLERMVDDVLGLHAATRAR